MTGTIKINGLDTFYKQEGDGQNLLLLHGWGGSIDSFCPVFDSMKKHFRVTAVDFWGFGKSQMPPEGVDTYWYARQTKEFLDKMGIKKTFVISHSFGGRVALVLADWHKGLFDKIVLCSSAGIRPRFSLKKYIAIKKYKIAKRFAKEEKLKKYGSDDYKNLDCKMQKTFVRVVNDFLECHAKNTVAQTLLVWGKEDKQTPLYMANKLNRLVKNSGLVVIEDAGHFCYIDNFYLFDKVVKSFFGVL